MTDTENLKLIEKVYRGEFLSLLGIAKIVDYDMDIIKNHIFVGRYEIHYTDGIKEWGNDVEWLNRTIKEMKDYEGEVEE